MRRSVSLLVALCCVVAGRIPFAQTPASGPDAFAGRWECTMQPASGAAAPAAPPKAFLIVEFAAPATGITGKLIDMAGAPMLSGKMTEVSVKDGQLLFVIEINNKKMHFTARRAGDRLDGTVLADGETQEGKWQGKTTTATLVPFAEPATAGSPDNKAYMAALQKGGADRTAALQQFLKDFPNSTLKEEASFNLAQLTAAPADRIAAYRKFLEDFPGTSRKDSVNLQIALAAPIAERPDALRKFIASYPATVYQEQAEYQLVQLITNADEKLAAQEKFAADHPRSPFTGQIYRQMLDPLLRAKPVNEAKINTVIDGYIKASQDTTIPVGQYTVSTRASALNTVADRLMATDVMLDRALELIQKAVTLAGEKEEPGNRSMYTTTLGEVQFKLKQYDEAGASLKKAVQISGDGGDGETQLFLGKFYEVKNDEEAALQAYLSAYEKGSPMDTKALLDRLYIKKYGSLDSLEKRLDDAYRAKPKPFEPGHFTRTADSSGKVVLAELFTGAECVPCVGADLAFDGLSERFDRETVAVLIYHLHIPGPDPMTNDDTEARANVYNVHATPTVIIDGSALQASGGSRTMSEGLFGDYKGRIESRLGLKPLASLTGFKAKLSGDTITVTGDATLSAEPGSAVTDASLHVALVDDSVRYVGANGIRFHTFVVRKLFGSAAGTPLAKSGSQTAYSESVSTSSVTAGLDAYLDKYEKSQSARTPFTFKERVDKLDAQQMLVVVFVQDEKTKAVLQSAVLPIGK